MLRNGQSLTVTFCSGRGNESRALGLVASSTSAVTVRSFLCHRTDDGYHCSEAIKAHVNHDSGPNSSGLSVKIAESECKKKEAYRGRALTEVCSGEC